MSLPQNRVVYLILAIALASLALAFSHFSLRTKAQTTSCSYKTHVKIFQDTLGGPLVSVEDQGDLKWIAVNNRGQAAPLDTDGKSEGLLSLPNMALKPAPDARYKPGEEAFVVLTHFDESEWTVKQVYCKENPGSTAACPSEEELTQQNLNPNDSIEGFHVNCGVDLEYGWVISSNKPRPTVTTTPQPSGNGSLTIDLLYANKPQDLKIFPADDPANKPIEICEASSPERPHFFAGFKLRADCISDEPDCKAYDPKKEKDITVDKRKGTLTFPPLPAGTYAINVKGIQEKGFKVASVCRQKTFTVTPGQTTSGVMILENFAGGSYSTTPTEGQCTSQGNKKASLIERVSGAICYSCEGKDCKGNETNTPTSPIGGPTNAPTTPKPPTGVSGNEIDKIVNESQAQCAVAGGKNKVATSCPQAKLSGKIHQTAFNAIDFEITKGYNPLQCLGLAKAISQMQGTPLKLKAGPSLAASFGNPNYISDDFTLIANPCWKKRVGSPEFSTCLDSITSPIQAGDYAVWDDEINNVFTGKKEIANHIAYVVEAYEGGKGRFKVVEGNYGGPGWVRYSPDKIVHDKSLKAWFRPKGASAFDFPFGSVRAVDDELKVIQTVPRDKTTNIAPDLDISFVFNRPIQSQEVELYSIPPITFEKTVSGSTAIFKHPKEDFPKNSQVILKLTYPLSNNPAEEYIEIFTGSLTSKKVDTRPTGLEKQDEETQKREMPDAFVKQKLQQKRGVYTFSTPFVRRPSAHYQFAVNLAGSDPRVAKQAFITDVLALGLDKGQFDSLDIRYFPDIPSVNWALVCDVNTDKACNTLDYARCIRSYGQRGENTCDMNLSNEINAIDISLMVKHLNE